MSDLFKPEKNCWRVERAQRAKVLIDGEDYFRALRGAMKNAQQRIILLGWDFDARLEMHDTVHTLEGPLKVGDYFDWLLRRNKNLHIHILRWDTGISNSLLRQNNKLTFLRWLFHPRIHFKLDSYHPVGAAQHQKVVVIDTDTAFCSGIDIANQRWDTSAHESSHELRNQPDGEDAGPWHDAAMMVQGPIAGALADFAETHWQSAGGNFEQAVTSTQCCWPDGTTHDFAECQMAVARTLPPMDGQDEAREIEAMCIDLIAEARDIIYAESQYFASIKIASAIAERLKEKDGPEVVVINPETADGWLESTIMDSKRSRLVEAVKKRDEHGRFRMYHPFTKDGTPIYVHAKILVIDDRIIRLGSSNFNNRSLGFDSECDVAMDASLEAPESENRTAITHVRNGLIAEHLGKTETCVQKALRESGSLIAAIEKLRGDGRSLKEFRASDLSAIEEWLAKNDVFDPREADDVFAGII